MSTFKTRYLILSMSIFFALGLNARAEVGFARQCSDQELRLADNYRAVVSRMVDVGIMSNFELVSADLTLFEVKRCRGYMSNNDYCSQSLQKLDQSMSRLSDTDLNSMPLDIVKDLLKRSVSLKKECN